MKPFYNYFKKSKGQNRDPIKVTGVCCFAAEEGEMSILTVCVREGVCVCVDVLSQCRGPLGRGRGPPGQRERRKIR